MTKVNLNKITNTNILIILQACQKLGIDFKILDWQKYKIKLIKNNKTHLIWKKSLGINPSQAIQISRDKHQTYLALKKTNLPVLPQIIIKNLKNYQEKLHLIPFPQVIKLLSGEKGKHIFLNIKTKSQGEKTIKKLLKKTEACVVEPFFKGKDYRFMVLNNEVIGLSQRKPPIIIADGKHNIKQLIEIENQKRLEYNQKVGRRMLNRMLIWDRIKWYLKHQGLKLTDIPSKNKKITVYPIANFSTGGTVETISLNKIHPSYLELAIKAAQVIGLTVSGIDILIKEIKKKATNKNCAIIEVNSDPGLRLHDWPNKGKPQGVAEKILGDIFNVNRLR